MAKIVRESGRAGSIAIPLVNSLKEIVGLFNKETAGFVHFGSTSQDVIDTALALVTREALTLIETDVHKAAGALLSLAERHAVNPVLPRTLMQPASVSSFGLKCAGWAAPLVRSLQRLQTASGNAISLQPARYVSGYMLTQPPPGKPRLIGADASHAWASVYCPAGENASAIDGHWLDFDPTNNRAPGEDYVTLATGRDFLDVSPLRGVIRGGSQHILDVAVTVAPVDEAQPAS